MKLLTELWATNNTLKINYRKVLLYVLIIINIRGLNLRFYWSKHEGRTYLYN